MFRTRVPLAILAAALIAQAGVVSHAAPQQPANAPAPADQTATFRGGINFVRVDATVTDKKGRPVTDLKQSDFEILEDDKPQSIEQFRLIKADGNPAPGEPAPREIRDRDDEEAQAARDDVRVVVIFLDDYHVRLANSLGIRPPLEKFLQTSIGPNDMVAVMYPLTPVEDLSFTRNVDSVISAIENFQGRKYDYTPKNQFEENYARYPAQAVEDIRNQVVMGALRGLAVRLGSMRQGRKEVIYVSEGLTVMLPPQMQKPDATGPDLPIDTSLSDSSIQQTQEWFASSDLNSRLNDVYTACNRNNTSLYTLDPRRLAVSEYDINDGGINGTPSFASDQRALRMTQDILRSMAEETDGRAIVNRNKLDTALAQVMEDESAYYLIGYNSKAPTDGKFHEIKVRVRRPGVDVRARKGYWAATVADVTKAASPTPAVKKPVEQALATIAPVVNAAHAVNTWIGTERGANGKTHVTVVWTANERAGDRGRGAAQREQPGALSILAADEKGDLVYRGRSAGAAPTSGTSGAPPLQRIAFDAPPGKLELKMTVEGADGRGTLDTDERTIDVPDFTAPQAALSTPRVFRTRTARDFNAIAADANAVPTVDRDFSRAERLLIRFDVYGPAGAPPMPVAALLNREGKKIADLPVMPATAGGTHQVSLGLNTLAAGEYLVQITAGPDSSAPALVPFRVGT
jgi:VWFA-related protein